MKNYVHARLDREARAQLDELKKATGESESALVKRGLRLVHQQVRRRRRRSVLDVARPFIGKYASGFGDLSTNTKHLDDFGK